MEILEKNAEVHNGGQNCNAIFYVILACVFGFLVIFHFNKLKNEDDGVSNKLTVICKVLNILKVT